MKTWFKYSTRISFYLGCAVFWLCTVSALQAKQPKMNTPLKLSYSQSETRYGSVGEVCAMIARVPFRQNGKWDKPVKTDECIAQLNVLLSTHGRLKKLSFSELFLKTKAYLQDFALLKENWSGRWPYTIQSVNNLPLKRQELLLISNVKNLVNLNFYYTKSRNWILGGKLSKLLMTPKNAAIQNLARWSMASLFSYNEMRVFYQHRDLWKLSSKAGRRAIPPLVQEYLTTFKVPKKISNKTLIFIEPIIELHSNEKLFVGLQKCQCAQKVNTFFENSKTAIADGQVSEETKADIFSLVTRAALMANNNFYWRWFEKIVLEDTLTTPNNMAYFNQAWAIGGLGEFKNEPKLVAQGLKLMDDRIKQQVKFPEDIGYVLSLGSRRLYIDRFICSLQKNRKICANGSIQKFYTTSFVQSQNKIKFRPKDLNWFASEIINEFNKGNE